MIPIHAAAASAAYTRLYLSRKKIGDEGAKAIAYTLKDNKTLTTLELSENEIGDEGAKSIAEALISNTTLTTLDLSKNEIGAEGATAIADTLKNNKTLITLRLFGNKIGDEGAEAIVEALKDNQTLTTLHLANNSIGAEGAKAFAEALRSNTTLTTLQLWANKIRAEGAKELAKALMSNTTLITLDLSSNNIGAKGAKDLAEALKVNKTLTTLKLRWGNIGVEGSKVIAEALKDNKTLKTLDLSWGNIGDEGAKAIAEALKDNKTLTTLDLYNDTIGHEGAKAIAEALEHNEIILILNGVKDSMIAPLLERNKRNRLKPFLSKYGDLPYKIKGLTSLYIGLSKEERETVEKEIAKQREGASAEQERLKAIYEQQPQRIKTQFPLLDRWRKAQKALYDNAIAQKQTTATFREWLYQTFPLENQTYNLYIYERQRDNQRHNYTNSQLLFEDWFTHKQEPLRAIYEQQSDELKQQTPFDMWLQNQRESYDEATHEATHRGASHTGQSSLSFEGWLSQKFPDEKQQYDFYLEEMHPHKGTKTSFMRWFDNLRTIYNRQSTDDKRQISFEDWAKIMRVSYEEAKQKALQTTPTAAASAAQTPATTITEIPLLADWLEAQYKHYQAVMAAAKPHPSFADWLKSNAHS